MGVWTKEDKNVNSGNLWDFEGSFSQQSVMLYSCLDQLSSLACTVLTLYGF